MMSIRDKRQKDGGLRDVVLELDVPTSKDTVRMREHYGYSCAGGRKKQGGELAAWRSGMCILNSLIPGPSCLQFLIVCSMRKQSEKLRFFLFCFFTHCKRSKTRGRKAWEQGYILEPLVHRYILFYSTVVLN